MALLVTKPEEVTAELQFPEPLPELLVVIIDELADDVGPVFDIDLAVVRP